MPYEVEIINPTYFTASNPASKKKTRAKFSARIKFDGETIVLPNIEAIETAQGIMCVLPGKAEKSLYANGKTHFGEKKLFFFLSKGIILEIRKAISEHLLKIER